MVTDLIISFKGTVKDVKRIAAFLTVKMDDEIVVSGKNIQIPESYALGTPEELEDLAVELAVHFPMSPFKLAATGDEKEYLYNVQILYDGNLVKSSCSDYYRIFALADTIDTYEAFLQSGIKLKLTEKIFEEIKTGKKYIYNLRPDAKKPKLSVKVPMNEEKVIYPKRRIILEPIGELGEITTISDQDQWGTTITAEMTVTVGDEPIFFLERHYDAMKTLRFCVTSESVRFFWEKKDKTDEERKQYEKIMAAAIEEYDSGFGFSAVCAYDGMLKLQLATLHKAIEQKAAELGITVTATWEM